MSEHNGRSGSSPDDGGERADATDAGRKLVDAAAGWMTHALRAWIDDDYGKVAVMAPLGVELLGKAVLWQVHPALLTPLSSNAEASLLTLTMRQTLTSPKLRTIGLGAVLPRLEQVLDGLPVDVKRRARMVEVRNGAVHVGAPDQSRHVLQDCLTLCQVMLARLDVDPKVFYGDHYYNSLSLLDAKKSELGHAVTLKMARAREGLRELEDRLGEDMFEELTQRLEEHGNAGVGDESEMGIAQDCPECGSKGRLYGSVDVDSDVEFDFESVGGGRYDSYPYATWRVSLLPRAFDCFVCRLHLSGADELNEATLPSRKLEVEAQDIGDDFDPGDYAEWLYGGE